MINKDYKQVLRAVKLKATPGRIELLAFLTNTLQPYSIKEIGKAVGSKTLDQATIYRNLEHFREAGLVRHIDFGDGVGRFELKTHNHHHHIICTSCRKVEDIHVERDVGPIEQKIRRKKHFTVHSHSLEFFGLCKACAK
ncbi:MAG: Fur family transcriptional regulator [Candidatus Doudnabacteria bacterium]